MRSRMVFFALFMAFAGAEASSRDFKDEDLKQWLGLHENGLILAVSDGMPYSQESVGIVSGEAKRKQLDLLILSDRPGPLQKKRNDALLRSDQLLAKGALRHFPSLFFVRNHQLLPEVIPGIQTQQELSRSLYEIYTR